MFDKSIRLNLIMNIYGLVITQNTSHHYNNYKLFQEYLIKECSVQNIYTRHIYMYTKLYRVTSRYDKLLHNNINRTCRSL